MNRILAYLAAAASLAAQPLPLHLLNGNRPVLDAHNCYPNEGRWGDRIDRALKTGYPVGIEQDLAWYVEPATGKGRVVVSHTAKTTGKEPTLRSYFFERVRPIIETLGKDDRAQWPLIVLHFDFKDNPTPLLRAVWEILGDYEDWISTARQTSGAHELAPIEPRPLLVLTEDNDAQENIFFKQVRAGGKLRLFGSAHTALLKADSTQERNRLLATVHPEQLLTERPTNYRRWWNNSWYEVEEGGQPQAGDWTETEAARLKALVNYAHGLGFWIRFYTLDGFAPPEEQGWGTAYNFGTRKAVAVRWKAALKPASISSRPINTRILPRSCGE